MSRKGLSRVVVVLGVVLAVAFGVMVPLAMAKVPDMATTFDSPVEPDPPAEEDVPTLIEVLGLLAQGVGVGSILAFLFEKMSWFQNLGASAKWWLALLVSLGLPLVAQVLLQFVPADVWAAIEPYWRSLALGFLTWSGGQIVHLVDKAIRASSG